MIPLKYILLKNLQPPYSYFILLSVDIPWIFYCRINESLSDVPLTSELRYTIGSRHSLRRTIPVKARTVFDCDFGAAPLNSENCVIHLVLKNDGAVSTEW